MSFEAPQPPQGEEEVQSSEFRARRASNPIVTMLLVGGALARICNP